MSLLFLFLRCLNFSSLFFHDPQGVLLVKIYEGKPSSGQIFLKMDLALECIYIIFGLLNLVINEE
jgi:hypothetical protein